MNIWYPTRHDLKSYIVANWSFLVLILCFVFWKSSHLDISFFWDESWVYAPAVRHMGMIGPSLLPNTIPIEYARGHPLFFHFLGGVWIQFLGEGFVSMHSFALSISVLFITTFYSFLSRFHSKGFAFWCSLIVIVQPAFVAQSSMVLPEILVALLCLLSLLFYASDRRWGYFIFCSLLLLTKESGVTVIGSVAIFSVIRQLYKPASWYRWISRDIALIFSPLILICLFLLLQFNAYGWVFYPDHISKISLAPMEVIYKVFAASKWLFWDQGRWLYTLLCSLIGVRVFYFEWSRKGVSGLKFPTPFMSLSLLFVLVYLLFTGLNFYTVRYLLAILPICIFLLTLLLYHSSIPLFFRHSILALAAIIGIYTTLFRYDRGINDVSLSFLNYCPIESEAIRYIEDLNIYDQPIYADFLSERALLDYKAGYRNTLKNFELVNDWEGHHPMRYYIFSNIEPSQYYDLIGRDPKSSLIQRWEKENVWVELVYYQENPE